MPLTAAQRADIQRLPLPLRTLALNASTGSFPSILALRRYWNTPEIVLIDEQTCCALLPVLLVSLDPRDVPDSIPEDRATQLLILRANRCLDLIALFAHCLMASEALSTFISAHHHQIFPWLYFLSVHFVGTQGLSPAASRLPVITDRSMIFTLAGILNWLSPTKMNLQPDTHTFIVDVVIDIWRKMLYIDVSSALGSAFGGDASLLTTHLSQILAHLLGSPTSLAVIDKLGGRSSIVALWMTHIEQAAQRFAAIPLTDICGAFQALTLDLVFTFSCFADEDFRPEINPHNVLPRISVVVSLLVERLNAVRHLRLPDTDTLPRKTSGMVYRYCWFIMTDLWALSPPLLLQSLKSGTLRYLRAMTRISPSRNNSKNFEIFVAYMTAHSIYPPILKHTCKLVQAYPDGSETLAWRTFDTAVAQYYRVWCLAGEVAQQFEKCSTCMVPRCQRKLKVCGGCRTILYCSAECQRIGRHQGHRLHCKLLQLSQAHSSLIGGCRGFLFLALLEANILSIRKQHLDKLLASTTFGPNEIPLILVEISAFKDATISKMADYPHIFRNELWEKELEPRFRAMMDAGRIPKYLSVFALPRGVENSYSLGAVATAIASGLLDSGTLSLAETRL